MKIIRTKKELEGTCYIEVLPGKHTGEFWNDNSIYFAEEAFGFIEKTIKNEFPGYDHYAYSEIHREIWLRILNRLNNLLDSNVTIELLRENAYFIFDTTEEEFIQDFDNNVQRLSEMIIEFQDWIREKLKTEEYVSVLGI